MSSSIGIIIISIFGLLSSIILADKGIRIIPLVIQVVTKEGNKTFDQQCDVFKLECLWYVVGNS
jgi:hypothetical protein